MLTNEVCGNYISPVDLFYAIFRLTDFSSDPFDSSSSKTGQTGSSQLALSAVRAFTLTSFQLCDSQKLFWRLILMVWRTVLRGWPPPPSPHQPPHFAPIHLHIIRAMGAPCSQRPLPPMPPPPCYHAPHCVDGGFFQSILQLSSYDQRIFRYYQEIWIVLALSIFKMCLHLSEFEVWVNLKSFARVNLKLKLPWSLLIAHKRRLLQFY